jgi:peptidoglycan/LPS O-acetylase OafA/YrhL
VLAYFLKRLSHFFIATVFIFNFFIGSLFNSMDYFYWQVPGRLNEFMCGVAIAKYLKSKSLANRTRKLNLLVGFSILVMLAKIINMRGGELMVDPFWGIVNAIGCLAFSLILLGSASSFKEKKLLRVQAVGRILAELSYGVYLYHFAIILYFLQHQPGTLFVGKNAITGAILGALLIYPVALLMSFVTHPIEKYFMNLRPIY